MPESFGSPAPQAEAIEREVRLQRLLVLHRRRVDVHAAAENWR